MEKYKFIMITAFLGMLLCSCKKTENSKKIEHLSEKTEMHQEDSKNLVSDLPQFIDKTDYIVFSIRNNVIKEQKRVSYSSGSRYDNYLDNLIFQHIKTQETHVLTKKKIKIISYERLLDSLNPSLNATLYKVIDSFPKDDKHESFTALYLSTNEGKNFTKITKANENLHSWKFLPETNNIYFVTNDDIDNNRKLNDKDRESIHLVDVNQFKRKDLLVEELQSLN